MRLAVDHGQEDHGEALLHLRVLVELVEDDLRFGAALELDDDAHAVAIALVANRREMSSMILSLTSSAMRSMSLDLLTW